VVLEMERQLGQVDGDAGEDDRLHRRLSMDDFDHRLQICHPGSVFCGKLALVNIAKRRGIAAAAAADRADDFEMLGADILEHARFG
jgi:hypothetical protein